MKSNLQGKVVLTLMMTSLLMLFSCKKVLDVKPLSEVDISQNYRNVSDVNAAVLGIYGKFMGIAEQYVVLNELRADLMDVTPNADKYLQEISQHHVTAGNPWADPRPYYQLILNCNDVLYNMNIMLAQNKISVADYNYRYSDIGALRSWIYLQLGIHWGNVPYVTDPLANINDLKDQSKFPRLDFPTLLSKLITFTAALPWLDPYPNIITLINGSTVTTVPTPPTISGFDITHTFIDKHCLLGDLYLWQAAYSHPEDYTLAATQYKIVLEYVQDGATNNTYRIEGGFPSVTLSSINDFGVDYIRYREEDINALVTTSGWRSMFTRSVSPTFDSKLNSVWIWQMFFPQGINPVDPFVDLFSAQGGRYLVQPSQQVIDYWNAQVQNRANGNNGNTNFSTSFWSDARMRLSIFDPTGNYNAFNNQNVIMKNLYTYQDATISQSNKYGRWFLYRDATLDLRYAECANRDGYGLLTYALINSSMISVFNPYLYSVSNPIQNGNGPAPLPPGTVVNGVNTPPNADYTNVSQTFYPAPYYIDARSGDTPRFRNGWYQSAGVRGRANLQPYPYNPANIYSPGTFPYSSGDPTIQEKQALLEAGMETAFEGHRWEDLLRIAIRENDPSVLSGPVGAKLSKDGYGGAATAQTKLQAKDWYLPFTF